jgi:hypothetical protein
MHLSSVFSKTPKGQEEIATRANRLPFRLRAMLIMVDGQRTGHQLLALSTSVAEGRALLAALLDGAFVQEEITQEAREGVLPQTPPADDISLAKSYAIHSLLELLGPQAGGLIVEIEETRTADELQQKVGKMRAALRKAADQKKAKQFLVKLALVLA